MNKLHINKYYNGYNKINTPDFTLYYDKYLPSDFNFNNYTILGDIDNIYNCYCKIHIESNYCSCYICNKNIDYENYLKKYDFFCKNTTNLINKDILYKLKDYIKDNNYIFVYNKIINESFQIEFIYYYHLCDSCYKSNLYFWYYKNKSYPKSTNDAISIIKKSSNIIPKTFSTYLLNKYKTIKFPKIYYCIEYYQNNYDFLYI